jgi:hypothetical protein
MLARLILEGRFRPERHGRLLLEDELPSEPPVEVNAPARGAWQALVELQASCRERHVSEPRAFAAAVRDFHRQRSRPSAPGDLDAAAIQWQLLYGPGIDANPDYPDSSVESGYLSTAAELVEHYRSWAKDVPGGGGGGRGARGEEAGLSEEDARYAAGTGQALHRAVNESGLPPHDPGRDEVIDRVLPEIEERPARASAGEPFTVEHFSRWAGHLKLPR